MGRQILQATPITSVYPVGFLSAGRAHRDGSPAASVDQDPLGSDLHVVDHETARRERLEPSIPHGKHSDHGCLPSVVALHEMRVRAKLARRNTYRITHPGWVDGNGGRAGHRVCSGRRQCHWWRQCGPLRSEEHTSELQSLMRISYAVFCLKKKKT